MVQPVRVLAGSAAAWSQRRESEEDPPFARSYRVARNGATCWIFSVTLRAMAASRAVCICGDAEVRGAVEDALGAARIEVEHHDGLDGDLTGFAMIVVDRAARRTAGDALRAAGAPVVVVGDDLGDDGQISLMLEAPVSHHVGDPCDRDLGITSEKLVTGDLFGLEKYVTAGARVGQRAVVSDADKRRAIAEVCTWAEGVGARRPVLHRLASVVDELLMNALLDAPRANDGAGRGKAMLRWAADDRVLAISVGDAYGSLRQRDVIDHVLRARHDRGRPLAETAPGAGLGLYLVLANVASLVVNVEPGQRTEVVCLFDLAHRDHRAVASGVRSLHVFALPA
jgi:anti-sigma regulatory factor (Ser/Thr protein kinase)